MSGETEAQESGWTVDTLKYLVDDRAHRDRLHFEDMRHADELLRAERDRRYTEVAIERENALKIKDEADHAALELSRMDRDYKDEKANNLREQIGNERGNYATTKQIIALYAFVITLAGIVLSVIIALSR